MVWMYFYWIYLHYWIDLHTEEDGSDAGSQLKSGGTKEMKRSMHGRERTRYRRLHKILTRQSEEKFIRYVKHGRGEVDISLPGY